jgi:hypothetical protein
VTMDGKQASKQASKQTRLQSRKQKKWVEGGKAPAPIGSLTLWRFSPAPKDNAHFTFHISLRKVAIPPLPTTAHCPPLPTAHHCPPKFYQRCRATVPPCHRISLRSTIVVKMYESSATPDIVSDFTSTQMAINNGTDSR